MKDLFSGSFGRLNNHGGSRMFTTPHTISVPPEYEVATDVPSAAEFVTCSLDGRLWVWKRSRRFYVSNLRWDSNKLKLVFAKTSTFSSINIIARGIDWILTDNSILLASEALASSDFFADSNSTFLFSVLRSKIFPSGIDPLTNDAWGLSDSNGNSDGYGFFNRSALLQSVNKIFSLLPAVGDWNIIGNFLVRRPDNPLSDSYNSMLNIRPLIPLEFSNGSPAYGSGFGNDIALTFHDGSLWGRGLYHIGKCYILPAVFDEEGNPQEFYLYISPDFTVSPYKSKYSSVTKSVWLNLALIHSDSNIYAFWSEKISSLDNGLCYSSEWPALFDPASSEWILLADDGSMFIDTLNNSGLVLNDDRAVFLTGDNPSYECKGLKQWLAPAGNVDAVTPYSVFSSADNAIFVTHFRQGFYREVLHKNNLPLSALTFGNKRFSINLNQDNNFSVSSLTNKPALHNIAWENIFRQAVSIRFINSFQHECSSFLSFIEDYDSNCYFPAVNVSYSVTSAVLPYRSPMPPGSTMQMDEGDSLVTVTLPHGISYGTDEDGNPIFPALHSVVNASGFFINPETGETEDFKISAEFDSNIPTERWDYEKYDSDWNIVHGTYIAYNFWSKNAVADIPYSLGIQDGKIGFFYSHYTYGTERYRRKWDILFRSCGDAPDYVTNWASRNNGKLSLTDFCIPSKIFSQGKSLSPLNIPDGNSCCAYAVFSEAFSNSNFFCSVPSALSINSDGSTSGSIKGSTRFEDCFNFWDSNSLFNDGEISFCKNGLHLAAFHKLGNNFHFLVFRSELHPQIFNFYSQNERSKLS